jgi:heptosyltransferase I
VARPDPIAWRLDLSEAERAEQQAFFAPLAGPVCAVVPASANPRKDWVAERHVELVDALADRGFAVVLVGGPGARETAIARMVQERARSTPLWGLGDGVRRLLWLIDGCDLVIAPDTGPVHIARARRVPVIGLYGHTNPWRVGPYRAYEDLWVDTYDDPGVPPDPSSFEPKHGRMERIMVADVMDRVDVAVSRYGVRTG